MNEGFSINCLKCNEKMIITKGFFIENDDSYLTISIMGSYPEASLYLVCTNCNNEIEIEL